MHIYRSKNNERKKKKEKEESEQKRDIEVTATMQKGWFDKFEISVGEYYDNNRALDI